MTETLSTLAWCWRLRRADGLTLCFTSHDRPLVIGGLTYRPNPGILPSALIQTAELSPSTMEIEGALGGWIDESDVRAGRWEGAELVLGLADWAQPVALEPMARGVLGEIRRAPAGLDNEHGSFVAELHADRALQHDRSTRLAPMCRARLGDGRCRVDLDLYRREVTLAAHGGAEALLDAALEAPQDWAGGMLRLLDGPWAGLEAGIAAVKGHRLKLDAATAWPEGGAVRARLTPGCDRRFETCRQRFGNQANFQGEPHLPGVDALVRHGGA